MAKLYVKSPNGTTYNMTIVTEGTTESLDFTGWCRFPNGLIMQWASVDVGSQPSGDSKWWTYLPISWSAGFVATSANSSSSKPAGYHSYLGTSATAIGFAAADGEWNWWPPGSPYGVSYIALGM